MKILLSFVLSIVDIGLPQWFSVKNLPVVQEVQLTQVQSLSQEDALEEDMAAYSSILARKILWSEELLRLQLWGCKELDATECACTRACPRVHTPLTSSGCFGERKENVNERSAGGSCSWTSQDIAPLTEPWELNSYRKV